MLSTTIYYFIAFLTFRSHSEASLTSLVSKTLPGLYSLELVRINFRLVLTVIRKVVGRSYFKFNSNLKVNGLIGLLKNMLRNCP